MRHFERDEQIETTMGNAIFVEYSNGGVSYRVTFTDGPNVGETLSLSERSILSKQPALKRTILTDVQRALVTDPTVLTDLIPYVTRIEISSSPNGVDSTAQAISENTSVTDTDALEFIRVVTDHSHGAKYDVIVRDTIPTELRERSKVFFNEQGHRAKVGELQIGSKALALWLIEQGIFPEKQTNDFAGIA